MVKIELANIKLLFSYTEYKTFRIHNDKVEIITPEGEEKRIGWDLKPPHPNKTQKDTGLSV